MRPLAASETKCDAELEDNHPLLLATAEISDAEGERIAKRSRVEWVDAARGIGILLVVYAHALRGLVTAGLYPDAPHAKVQELLIYAFHMPLFFFIAGLWVERSLRRDRTRFLSDKLVTIAWPYLLWSLIEGTITVAVAPATNGGMTSSDVFGIALAPIHHYWFLYALFLCHLVAALTGARLWLMAPFVVLAFIVPPDWHPIATKAASELPYYMAGIFLARLIPLSRIGELPGKYLLFAAPWAAFAALAIANGAYAAVPGFALQYALGALGIAGCLGLALLLRRSRLLLALGNASMAIFVLHTLFSAGFRVTIVQLGIEIPPVPLLVLVTLAGVAGPMAAYWLARRYGLLKIAGLGSDRGMATATR